MEESEDGKKRYKRNDKGTPQGGVISPLLANVYLNVLDRIWKLKKIQERLGARLVRYADDFVVLCGGNTERVLRGIETVLNDLGLKVNESKTKIIDATRESFDFLGFTCTTLNNPKSGKRFPFIRPSKKALQRIRTEIKHHTNRRNYRLPAETVVKMLNESVRGWTNYFYYRHCSKSFSRLDHYLQRRMFIYLRRKHKWKISQPYQYMYETLDLFKIPTNVPRTRYANAAGRR